MSDIEPSVAETIVADLAEVSALRSRVRLAERILSRAASMDRGGNSQRQYVVVVSEAEWQAWTEGRAGTYPDPPVEDEEHLGH